MESYFYNRREFLKVMGIGAASTALASCTSLAGPVKAAKKRPNIIYIMTDDHASHAMSWYGSRINKTPNLDRIAKEGVFIDASPVGLWCGPRNSVLGLPSTYTVRHIQT